MSKNNEPITAASISREVANWIEQDSNGGGAWSMFTLCTLKNMKLNFDVTMDYLSCITKEQFDYVCEAIDEVVYHFQKIEMVTLIEALYVKFYGKDENTVFYRDNIAGLRHCIKEK